MESIKTLLDQNFTPQLIATILDTTLERVVEEMNKMDLFGWGNPGHYTFIIARKYPAERRWNERFERILASAREKHDQGLITMVQVRDDDMIIQYAMPVERPVSRRLWFTAPPETY